MRVSLCFVFAGKAGCCTMLITRIELENIKSYRRISVELRQGTTAISGSNGAGKTTLVEAIGFALFDYLPYNRDQFVREGEKTGRVIIHLIGSDDRPYTVERRCGSGSRWIVYDEEADMRLEQKADVLDKLHEIFGIDRERPLDSLFRDALGVPQGTFTAIFLDVASKRKQTFDALLQIEDYKTAADNLLETKRYYDEQLRTQQSTIERLEFETRDLENWRTQLNEARQLDTEQKQHNIRLSEDLVNKEERKQQLDEQAARLNDLAGQQREAQAHHDYAQTTLRERIQATERAQAAHDIVQGSAADYSRFQQANETLRRLRQDASQRDTLRQQQAIHNNTQTQIMARIQNFQDRLSEITIAQQKVIALAPLVDQQSELEQQHDEMRQQVQRHEEVMAQGQKLSTQIKGLRQQQEECQQQISAIEPLIPLAHQLDARNERVNQLRIQISQRDVKNSQLQTKQKQLQAYQSEQVQLGESLRKAEKNIQLIEANRSEAAELPALQTERERLIARGSFLDGNIEGYARSRAQSAGGQCPLLNESCLNIQQRGTGSLEAYFENLLVAEKEERAKVLNEQNTIDQSIHKIKPYAEALLKYDMYVVKRDNLARDQQRNTSECERLTQEIAALTQELEQLTQVDQQRRASEQALQESKQADLKVRELNALKTRNEHLQQQSEQLESTLQELRTEATRLNGSREQLQQITAELSRLNDPRSQSREHRSIIAREAQFQQQLLGEESRLTECKLQLQSVDAELMRYNTLDNEIAQQEQLSQQSEAGHRQYQMHINEAQTLEQRRAASQQQQQVTDEAAEHLQTINLAHQQAQHNFDAQELYDLRAEIDSLKSEQSGLIQQMIHHQERINHLESAIQEAETLRSELVTAQQEFQTVEDLQKMLSHFRNLIKEAAPFVLRAMLADISAEANRIFGEIMGDRSAQLSWHHDYEIILRRQGVDRSFAQLSGGEQMSAALAVRLALLKKLSTLNLAFFDEPTQNMDELRRMNLAEQIRRVRGFDQLIVISHDDTFEQGLDSLIRLNKISGETQIADEDGILPSAELGQAWQSAGLSTGSQSSQSSNSAQTAASLLQTTN